MAQIYATIACTHDAAILTAAYPLLSEGKVEALEWAFDSHYKLQGLPPWFEELLSAYSSEQRLVGHGIFFSLFSGRWSDDQQKWLDNLRLTSRHFTFDHISEHFGFMSGKDFHQGAPLGIPRNATTLAIGQDRLKRIQEAAACPVGLENLAFSYSLDEVKKHGEFLLQLIEPVNGFIILDLHNLYCQMKNFALTFSEIINVYPLNRVREIHISGGSWDRVEEPENKIVRRDTHDDQVPGEIFELLEITIKRCPNLKFIVLEQIGSGLISAEEQMQFQNDFNRLAEIVSRHNHISRVDTGMHFLPISTMAIGSPVVDELLWLQQKELSRILEESFSYAEAKATLDKSMLANSDWDLEHWEPYMLETARKIARKWKDGFA